MLQCVVITWVRAVCADTQTVKMLKMLVCARVFGYFWHDNNDENNSEIVRGEFVISTSRYQIEY